MFFFQITKAVPTVCFFFFTKTYPNHSYCLAGREVLLQSGEQMGRIDTDVHEYIQRFNSCNIHGDEARMCIMYQQITSKSPCSVIIDTACSICYVSHYQRFDSRAELGENI